MTGESKFEYRKVLPDIKDSFLNDLAVRCYLEFGDVSDFIWKSPRLLESETRLEKRKLKDYFPFGENEQKNAAAQKLRLLRWELENRKLTGVFPLLIATGNLFNSVALFETYCLMLCKEAEKRSGKRMTLIPGSGVGRLFAYLKTLGIDRTKAKLREQVDAAVRIRNCVFHANGLLAWSKDEKELRVVVKKHRYLSPDDRARRSTIEDWEEEVLITSGPLGEQLQITNHYSHVLTSYLKIHFVDICDIAQAHM